MRINICHVTDAQSIEMANAAGFTTEVTPHHLFFCAEDSRDAYTKVNPPLRNRAVRDALFTSFMKGNATMFGTDHAPHTLGEKGQDYESAPGGIPSVETNIPVFMAKVKQNMFPLGLLVRMGAEMPAKVFGIPKGRIEVGYDADFAVFDMRRMTDIDVNRLHSRSGYSPYEGWDAVFPDTVIVRGETQISEGEFCGSNTGRDVCDAGD